MRACPERASLLTAELETLRGRGDDPLKAHLARCPGCAAAARRIVEETERLDTLLAEPGARTPDAAALIREAARVHGAPPPPRRLWAHTGRWGAAAGLVAAAAATFLLLRPADRAPPPGPAIRTPEPPPPLVEEAPGRDVAILTTDDPDITVLWFF